jgi:hypothetical protein
MKKLKLMSALLLMGASSMASAEWITFTDRAAFESYVGTFTIDDLESVASATGETRKTVDSGDFSWTMRDYNCENGLGCGATYGSDTSNGPMMESEEDDFIWTYDNGTFVFNEGISAFGMQYGSVNGPSSITLNGFNSGVNPTGSFFGIASNSNELITNIAYVKSGSYSAFDEVTYKNSRSTTTSSPVPISGSLSILLLGLFGLSRKKKA